MNSPAKNNKIPRKALKECRGQILAWYDTHRREMPWRAGQGITPDPYAVWLSEIMLQQTTVQTVTPYFIKFLSKWPTIFGLAAASQEEVLHEWAGLGYYSRGRNLHAAAQIIASEYGGIFPADQVTLRRLPGIGDYTSAAIMTIAFNKPATVMDGNIERVMARLFAESMPLPASKPLLKQYAESIFMAEEGRYGDLAQALMDLGSQICTPRSPSCAICPIKNHCKAFAEGNPADYPFKSAKKKRPQKYGYVYWITDDRGNILTERRPSKGMLAGMLGLPTSEWTELSPNHPAFIHKPKPTGETISHSFTHFDLDLHIHTATISGLSPLMEWIPVNSEQLKGMPTLFKKVYTTIYPTVY